MQETKKPLVEVLSIADDIEILSIFRYRLWKVNEGIDFLVGIFEENKLPDGSSELVTLDGKHYSNALHKAEFEDLNKRSKILEEIWRSSYRQKDRYWPRVFLDWGMKHRDIAAISWYDDAHTKGLLTEILTRPASGKATEPPSILTNKEKQTLLTIIAGMLHEKYNYRDHGIQKMLMRHIESAGLSISENTLSKHYQAAVALLSPTSTR